MNIILLYFNKLLTPRIKRTTDLSHIINAFSNFRLVAQIREEIEKVKPNIVIK